MDYLFNSDVNILRGFEGFESFDEYIADWDTASVTNMRYMFCGASIFNQPLGSDRRETAL